MIMDVPGAPSSQQASRVVYTGMLNAHSAGYEADVTVSRIGHDRFLLISPTAQATRDVDHLKRHVPDGAHVNIDDVTSAYSVLALMGPHSRQLLERLVRDPSYLTNEAFPFGTSRRLDVGHISARVARVTYVGELGYELYVPPECSRALYEALYSAAEGSWKQVGMQVGGYASEEEEEEGGSGSVAEPIDLRDGGYYAIDSLRLEAGYRAWGHELGVSDTPLDAGLGFTVDWSKESFIGREALLKLKEDPSLRTNRLVTLHVPDEATPLWGSEPILRDGEVVGNLTSVGYAHSVGGQVGLGYLKHADAAKKGFVKAGSYQIDAGGQLLPATATLKPLIDSKPRVQGDYSNA